MEIGVSGQAGIHALLTVVLVLKPKKGHVTVLLPHTVVVHVLEMPKKTKTVTQALAQVIISFL